MPGFLYDTYKKIQVTFKQVLKTCQLKEDLTTKKNKKARKKKVKSEATSANIHLRDLPRAEKTGKVGMSSGLTKAQ